MKAAAGLLPLPPLLLAACSPPGPESGAEREAAVAERAQAIENAADEQVEQAVNALEPVAVWSPAAATPPSPSDPPR